MKAYDVSFSLGDGLRPGSVARRERPAQFAELETLGELTKIAWKHDVQTMIEGPGHVPTAPDPRSTWSREAADLLEAPFYTLGPLVTDIAPGYDHYRVRDRRGHDRMVRLRRCCATSRPRNTWACPTREDVKQGVITYKIAAHAADIGAGTGRAREPATTAVRGRGGSSSLAATGSDLSLDPGHGQSVPRSDVAGGRLRSPRTFCSMCGPKFCAMQITEDVRRAAQAQGLAPDQALEAGLQAKAAEFRKRGGALRRTELTVCCLLTGAATNASSGLPLSACFSALWLRPRLRCALRFAPFQFYSRSSTTKTHHLPLE